MSAGLTAFIASIDWNYVLDLFLAASLGGIVSSGELIARYRDKPLSTIQTPPALFYMLINATASASALALIRGMGWTFGSAGQASGMLQIFVAGFGAMAIFRSAFFTVRVGDNDVAVGASSFLQVALTAADNEVDRRRARVRADLTQDIMKRVSYEKAFIPLPTYAMGLMQNLSKEEREGLQQDALAIHDLPGIDDSTKAQLLGLAIINYVGEDVLMGAVRSLGDKIENSNGAPPEKAGRESILKQIIPKRSEKAPKPEETPNTTESQTIAPAGVAPAPSSFSKSMVSDILDEEPQPPGGAPSPQPRKPTAGADSPSSIDLGKVSDILKEDPDDDPPVEAMG
jgi:hypothetical protein